MANEQNLKPIRDSERARELQEKSVIARKRNDAERKQFREYMEDLLEEKGSLNGRPATKKEIAAARAVQILLDPKTKVDDFLKAFEKVRDTIGE